MKIRTGGRVYAVVGSPGMGTDCIRYPLDAAPTVGKTVRLEAEDGTELRTDAVADWQRVYAEGSTLVLSNLPEPGPTLEPPEPSAAELRERAYDSEALIVWPAGGENHITVTEAARLWTYYTSEGDAATATVLTEEIARAKGVIRGRFPDLDTGGGV